MQVRNEEREMEYDGEVIKRIMQNFFQQRLKHPRESNPNWDAEWNAPGGPKQHIIEVIRTGELVQDDRFHIMQEEDFERYCTTQLKRGKAAGREGLVYELLLNATAEVRRWFFHTYYGPYSRGEARRLPGAESGATAVLPKPGDYSDLNRTRPIGLREPTHQIADGTHAEVGRREISRVADKCLHGFTRNRDIVEGTMEVRAITEFMLRMLITWLWLATDVAKAYDEVYREAITAVMEGLRCPKWWITHWERSWEGVRACIRTPHGETGWVEWRRGMVQGVRSACMHYVIVTIYMARAITQEFPKVHQVWVADDGFFGTTLREAQEFLPFLRNTYRPIGLRIAQEKLEVYGVNMQQNKEAEKQMTRNICEVK
jgi:hypothetical protein